jgi:glyceraldehyde 3-phosphate dehydrogenase
MVEETYKESYNKEMDSFVEQKRQAVSLATSVGNLLLNQSVELVLFRNDLADTSVSEKIQLMGYAKNVVNRPINIKDVADIAATMDTMNLAPAKIDIGKLAANWSEQTEFKTIQEFLDSVLSGFLLDKANSVEPRDVVLFGFGRIGRLVARELIKQFGKGQQLRLRAIVTRSNDDATIIKRAALLRNDSVHGKFAGSIVEDLENKQLVINGQQVLMLGTKDAGAMDYESYGITNALMIDNTGIYTDKEALGIHMRANGISKVLLTAPGGGIPNIVYGINHWDLDLDAIDIYSAASCTTNAISPVLKVVNDNLGLEQGHVETIHAYTNDQNLLDNMHKKPRRGRSAAINMVITSTGAGKAVAKVIPELAGLLTANAVRVPTPNGSLAILKLKVKKETSVEDVNALMRDAALNGNLVNQINYQMDPELVSNDIIGNTCCSVYDSNATLVHSDGKNIVLYAWYDNEFGYVKQVIRLAKYIAKVRRLHYY